MLTVNLGTKDAPINPRMTVKTSGATVANMYDVRLQVWNYMKEEALFNEPNYDYIVQSTSRSYEDFDLRTGVGANNPANIDTARPTAYNHATEIAKINIMFSLRQTFTLNIEYVTVECYPAKPIAIPAGAPVVNSPSSKAYDKFSSQEDIVFAVNTNGNALTAVAGPFDTDGSTLVDADKQITSANYTLGAGVTDAEAVTVKKDYLKSLSVGDKYFKISNEVGSALAKIAITDSTPTPVTSASITNKIVGSTYAGNTYEFVGSYLPANATSAKSVWSVSDSAVATINSTNGAIKFLKAGTVTVTLTVTGKTITGADDTPKTDTNVITVAEHPIVPIITTPIYNAHVKNGLLVKIDKKVNDASDALATMRLYFGGILVYEGEYNANLGIDTTKFANQNVMLVAEFETVSGLKSRVSVPVIIENESLSVFNPRLDDMVLFTKVGETSSITAKYDEFDSALMTGVEFKTTAGTGQFYSNTFYLDGTKAKDIEFDLNVAKFAGVTEASKLTTQLVIKTFGGFSDDMGVYAHLEIRKPGFYTMNLLDMLDASLAGGHINQAKYDAIKANNNMIAYLNFFTENASSGVIDNYSVNYKFTSTDNTFASYDSINMGRMLNGGTLKYSQTTNLGNKYYVVTSDTAGQQSEGSVPKSFSYFDFGTALAPINPSVTVKLGNTTSNFDLRFRVEGETDFDYLFADSAVGGTKDLRTATNAPATRAEITGVKKVEFFVSLRGVGYVEFENIALAIHTTNGSEVIADTLAKTVVGATVEGETSKSYDIYTTTEDLSFVINSDGLDITLSGNSISYEYYTFSGKNLAISATYLSALAVGNYEYVVTNGVGEPTKITVVITDSRPLPPVIIGDAVKSFDKNKSADVSFNVDLKNSVAQVTGGGITTADYTLESGVLTIKKEFLATLSNGTRTFTITTDGGIATVKVEVSASEIPKNGCGGCSSTAGAMSLLILPLAGLLFVRRKR